MELKCVGQFSSLIAFHKKLQNKFKSLMANSESEEQPKASIAAGIFLQNGLKIRPTYLEQVENDAGTVVKNVDFESSAAEVTDAINA